MEIGSRDFGRADMVERLCSGAAAAWDDGAAFVEPECAEEERVAGLARVVARGPVAAVRYAGMALFRRLIGGLGGDAFRRSSTRERMAAAVVVWLSAVDEGGVETERSEWARLCLSICGCDVVESLRSLVRSSDFSIASTTIRSLREIGSAESLRALHELFHGSVSSEGELNDSARFLCAIQLLSAGDLSSAAFLRAALPRLSDSPGICTALDLALAGDRAGREFLEERLSQGIDRDKAQWWRGVMESLPEADGVEREFLRSVKQRLEEIVTRG